MRERERGDRERESFQSFFFSIKNYSTIFFVIIIIIIIFARTFIFNFPIIISQ
jgi:hypothetical protein